MQLAARIYASFRVAGRGAFLMFELASDTAKLRVGDKIQLRRPTGESTDAIVKGTEHVEPKKRVLPYNVTLALKPLFTMNYLRKTRRYGSPTKMNRTRKLAKTVSKCD